MGGIRYQIVKNDTQNRDDTVERAPGDVDPPPPPAARPPLWRRLVRRDAGFGVLVLGALLVTVLVISRLPPSPSSPSTTTLPNRASSTATSVSQSAAIVQRANAEVIRMPTSRAGLMQPAVDAQGNIWVGEMVTNQLARIDPKTGQISEWTPPGGKYNIMATAIDRQGDIWFTEQAANYIGRFDPVTQTFKIYSLDTAIAPRMAPQDLAFDANGKLWFTLLGGRIGQLDPATGAMQSWEAPRPQGASRSYPFSLAITPDGVWFGYLTGGALGKLDPATGKVTLTPLANRQAAVYAMAVDASGRLWFSEMQPAFLGSIDPATGKVTELPVPGLAGDPSILYSLVTTTDGSVWFASAGANAVIRYQAEKDLFTFYQLPASQSIPFGLALGHDGSLWISGDGAADNYVARLAV
jgi:virginiamycin B lyase